MLKIEVYDPGHTSIYVNYFHENEVHGLTLKLWAGWKTSWSCSALYFLSTILISALRKGTVPVLNCLFLSMEEVQWGRCFYTPVCLGISLPLYQPSSHYCTSVCSQPEKSEKDVGLLMPNVWTSINAFFPPDLRLWDYFTVGRYIHVLVLALSRKQCFQDVHFKLCS